MWVAGCGDMIYGMWCKRKIEFFGIIAYYYHKYGKCDECNEWSEPCPYKVKRPLLMKE